MTLDLARIGPLIALPAAATARDDSGAWLGAHSEKITLSAAARDASRAAAPVPQGTVRWYRAARSSRPSVPAPAPGGPARATHAGVAAYRRAMASAAAAA